MVSTHAKDPKGGEVNSYSLQVEKLLPLPRIMVKMVLQMQFKQWFDAMH